MWKIEKHRSLFIIVFSIFLGTVAPNLFSDGMFTDGLTYAAISRNMSAGLGSFWKPHFSYGLFPEFYEHPPLALGLQSICYKLFGDSIYIERFYSLFTFLLVGLITIHIWKYFTKSHKYVWLPLLLWITVSKVSWACANNLLENTMTVFVSLSVLLFLKSREKNGHIMLVLSGLVLSLAFLTKGFTGLYVWSMPLFAWLIYRKESFVQMFLRSLVMASATALPIVSLYLFSESASIHLNNYLNHQVIGSIQNVATVDSRFAITREFLQNSIIPLVITLLLLALGIRKNREKAIGAIKENTNHSLFLFLVVLSGILPIMISLKQRGFYILTVYPLFAVSLGMLVQFKVETFISRISEKQTRALRIIALSLLIISISISVAQVGRTGRDKEKIADCHAIIQVVEENSLISLSTDLYTDWSLHGYMARYGNVSLMVNDSVQKYYLTSTMNEKLPDYFKVDVELNNFVLFQKR